MNAFVKVEHLKTVLDTGSKPVTPVDDVSFELRKGECFALVGESGCGKSMTALSLTRLLPEAGRIAGGGGGVHRRHPLARPERAVRPRRGRRLRVVFHESPP